MKEEKAVLTTEVNKQQKLLEKCNRGVWSKQLQSFYLVVQSRLKNSDCGPDLTVGLIAAGTA